MPLTQDDARRTAPRSAQQAPPAPAGWRQRWEIRQSQRALDAADLQGVLDALPLSAVVSDRDGVIRRLNAAARASIAPVTAGLGLTPDDLIGLPAAVLEGTEGYPGGAAGPGDMPFSMVVDNGFDVVELTVDSISHEGEQIGTLATWTSMRDRLRTEQVLADVAADNDTVSRVIRGLDPARTPVEAALATIEAVRTGQGWDVGTYWEADADGRGLRLVAGSGGGYPEFLHQSETHVHAVGSGVVGRAWAAASMVAVDDLSGDTCPRTAAAAAAGLRTAAAIPIVVDGAVVGVFDLWCASDHELVQARRETLANIGQLLSHAVTRLLSERAAIEAGQNTAAVAELLSALVGASTADEAGAVALSTVRSLFGWSYGSLWRRTSSDSGDRLAFALDSGSADPEFVSVTRSTRYREGEGLCGRAWQQATAVTADDLGQLLDCPRTESARRHGIRNSIAIPVVVEGEVVATMDFLTDVTGALSATRVETMRTIGRLLSHTFGRIAVEDREREAARALQDGVDELLAAVRAAAGGDLTQTVAVTGNGSLEVMSDGLAEFMTRLRQSLAEISESAYALGSAGAELETVSGRMIEDASSTSDQVELLTLSAGDVAANVEGVAGAAEQLKSSIAEIAVSATTAARVAGEAVAVAMEADESVRALDASSSEIGKVIKTITDIADQTNLLALNATIEAARAGEAGKGFAVVATEVKELAKETARATDEISRRITAIQESTRSAIDSITQISGVIQRIDERQAAISTAVEEQTATTSAIAYNVSAAAAGAIAITEGIRTVGQAADRTRSGALDSQVAAQGLARMSTEMLRMLRQFRY